MRNEEGLVAKRPFGFSTKNTMGANQPGQNGAKLQLSFQK
jgi:hypothetical protein